jgi:hypothetical protein
MAALCSDIFGFRLTAIVVLSAFSLCAKADIDLTLDTALRSYPLSGVLEADVGYDYLLWGSATPGAKDNSPWYGYVRPSANSASSLTYNSLGAALDVYPLSFLGLRIGAEGIQDDSNYTGYDCSSYQCRGRFYRNYAQVQLSLGYAKVFFQGRIRRERWSQGQVSTEAFLEPTNGFALAPSGDAETVWRGLLGYKLDDNWMVAGLLIYAQADSNHGISRCPLGVVGYTWKSLSVAAGVGVFESPIRAQEGTGILIISWSAIPGLAL